MSVVIETTIGDITVDLFLKERPRACQNFLKLCKLKYYNFCLFHTVQRDFIAQTGDPEGTGKGGTSLYGIMYGDQAKYFEAERTPKLKHQNTGTLSFASHGDNMLGSQFFVTLAEELAYLDGEHCVFGQVVEGHDVLVKLNTTICDDKYQPYQDIRITHTVVLDDPLDDPAGLDIPDRSPSVTDAILNSGRIAAGEDLEDSAGRTAEELDELIEQREAQARATILEMVGDLPDADSAPPENVLFICKLNPVTTDDDLQVIFSRFGKVVSCEIIRDQKTKNSLQYGFIEFDNPKSCENAYFKMDNVLIDDRRIHVDFSQSVSKVQWRGKGRVTYESGTAAGDLANLGGGGGGGGGGRGRGGFGRGRGRGGGPDGDRGRGRGGRSDGDRGRHDRRHEPHRDQRDHRDRNGADRGDRDPDARSGRRERPGAEDQLGGLNVGQLKALLGDKRKKRDDSAGSSDGDNHNKQFRDRQKLPPDSERRSPRREESRDKRKRSPSPSPGVRSSRKEESRNKSRRSPSPSVRSSKKEESRNKKRRSPSPDERYSRKDDSRNKKKRSPSPDARPSRNDDSRDKRRRSPSPDARPARKTDSRDKRRRSPSPDARPSRNDDSRDKRRRSPSPDARTARKTDSRDKRRRSPSPDARSPVRDARDRRRRSPSPDMKHSKKKEARGNRRRSPSSDDERPSHSKHDKSKVRDEQDVASRKKKKHKVKKSDGDKRSKKKEKKRRRSTSSESSSSSDSSSDEDRRKHKSKRR